MASKLLICAVVTCFLGVFLSVEFFQPYRRCLAGYIPQKVKSTILSYTNKLKTFIGVADVDRSRVMTKTELAKYDGKDGGEIYLALLGKVYDVTKGRRHYGPNEGYHGFAGKDGTRAFVSGEFDDTGLIEDIKGLQLQDIIGLDEWQKFYEKDYKYVGKLVGLYYDEDGNPTSALHDYQNHLEEALEDQRKARAETVKYPPCNSEWSHEGGTKVWCTKLSGGIKRNWVGVPRQYFQPGHAHARCACVRTTGPPTGQSDSTNHKNRGDLDNPNMKIYPGCDPNAELCVLSKN